MSDDTDVDGDVVDFDVAKEFYSRHPSGRRPKTSVADATLVASRTPHEQKIDGQHRRATLFSGAQFLAHVRQNVTVDAHGDLNITLTVPFAFKDLAWPLTDVAGVPLSVDVQVWKPFNREGT